MSMLMVVVVAVVVVVVVDGCVSRGGFNKVIGGSPLLPLQHPTVEPFGDR